MGPGAAAQAQDAHPRMNAKAGVSLFMAWIQQGWWLAIRPLYVFVGRLEAG
jgi:hypothetical protein